MKQFITRTLLALTLVGSASAQAAFIGDFASGDWVQYLGGGSVINNSADSITLDQEVVFGTKDPVTEAGNVAFDYDPDGTLGICVNDACVDYSTAGHADISLAPGDNLTFKSDWENISTISNLKTSAIPEPATPALMGAGLLLGLAVFGRRKSS